MKSIISHVVFLLLLIIMATAYADQVGEKNPGDIVGRPDSRPEINNDNRKDGKGEVGPKRNLKGEDSNNIDASRAPAVDGGLLLSQAMTQDQVVSSLMDMQAHSKFTMVPDPSIGKVFSIFTMAMDIVKNLTNERVRNEARSKLTEKQLSLKPGQVAHIVVAVQNGVVTLTEVSYPGAPQTYFVGNGEDLPTRFETTLVGPPFNPLLNIMPRTPFEQKLYDDYAKEKKEVENLLDKNIGPIRNAERAPEDSGKDCFGPNKKVSIDEMFKLGKSGKKLILCK